VHRQPIITIPPSRSTPSSSHLATSQLLHIAPEVHLGPYKHIEPIMQGTTFEVEWSVMDLKNSSVFAPTSAQPSRRPSATHPLLSQSRSQSHCHSQIVVLPLVRLCITFLLNLSLSSSPLSALKPDSMSSGKGARSGAVVELLSAS
jgi:hypothetical protein